MKDSLFFLGAKGEEILDSLKREIFEETKILNFQSINFLGSCIANITIPGPKSEKYGLIIFAYKCLLGQKTKVKISSEHTNFKFVEKNEAIKLLSTKYPMEFLVDILSGMA
jgi:hypothetical protein